MMSSKFRFFIYQHHYCLLLYYVKHISLFAKYIYHKKLLIWEYKWFLYEGRRTRNTHLSCNTLSSWSNAFETTFTSHRNIWLWRRFYQTVESNIAIHFNMWPVLPPDIKVGLLPYWKICNKSRMSHWCQ